MLLISTYKPVKVSRYLRTPLRIYASYIIYLCWNYHLKLHLPRLRIHRCTKIRPKVFSL